MLLLILMVCLESAGLFSASEMFEQVFGRNRLAKIIALKILAAPVFEQLELFLAPHPFGNDFQAQVLGHRDDSFNNN
jgi:hypothetical protein